MPRARRRFGLLFYVTATVAVVILASIPFWQGAVEQATAWRLSRRLHDSVDAVRRSAAEGLVQLGPAASPWVIEAMRDPDARVRLFACSILVRTAPDAAELPLRALVDAGSDSDVLVRHAAVGQLGAFVGKYGSPAESQARDRAVRALCAALHDADPDVRGAAGWALFHLGPKATIAVDELDRTLTAPDKPLRGIAARALLRIDPSGSRPAVVAAMSALLADQSIRSEHLGAVQILVQAQGEDATAAMLAPLLEDRDHATRVQAVNSLILQCPHANSLKPTLVKALASSDGFVRDEAALFLLKHEPGMAPRIVDVLADQIVDPLDGGYVLWDLIAKMREASPGSIIPLVPVVAARLARAEKPEVS